MTEGPPLGGRAGPPSSERDDAPAPLKVMHVIDGLGYGGGAEESLVASLPILRARGIDSSVVCLFDRSGWQDDLRARGFPVTVLRGRSRPARVRDLRRVIVRERPDVVHAVLVEATLTARLACVGLPVGRIDSLVSTTYDPSRLRTHGLSAARVRALWTVDALTSRLVSRFHVLTDAVAREAVDVLRIPPERVTRIPRGRSADVLGRPSTQRRAMTRRQLGLSDTDQVLLNVGRQDPQKAKLDLVAAFQEIASRLPDAVLLIAGREGSDTARLARAVRESPHSARIRVLGHRSDVPDLICAADVFVFPSLFEGFGGSLIEAMGLGCPIIGSDAPAVLEVLEGGRLGVVVRRGDIPGLAQAVIDLLLDPARRADLAQRARSRFEEQYELGTVGDAMAALYRDTAPATARDRAHRRSLLGSLGPTRVGRVLRGPRR